MVLQTELAKFKGNSFVAADSKMLGKPGTSREHKLVAIFSIHKNSNCGNRQAVSLFLQLMLPGRLSFVRSTPLSTSRVVEIFGRQLFGVQQNCFQRKAHKSCESCVSCVSRKQFVVNKSHCYGLDKEPEIVVRRKFSILANPAIVRKEFPFKRISNEVRHLAVSAYPQAYTISSLTFACYTRRTTNQFCS